MIQGKFMAEIMRMFVVVMGIFCDIMMEWKRLRIFGRSLADSPGNHWLFSTSGEHPEMG